jgi:hypothetical protein
MPIYQFRIKGTDEAFEEMFTFEQKRIFLEENPEFEQIIGAPAIISGVSGVTHKTDGEFNDLLNRIGNANPYSPLAQQYGDKSVKATKIRDAVNKTKNKA